MPQHPSLTAASAGFPKGQRPFGHSAAEKRLSRLCRGITGAQRLADMPSGARQRRQPFREIEGNKGKIQVK